MQASGTNKPLGWKRLCCHTKQMRLGLRRKGVWVSLGFFEDVFVPSYSLQQPAEFSEADKAWRWAIEDGELITGAGDPVRLRVVDVKFSTVPTPAQLKQQGVRLSLLALMRKERKEGGGGGGALGICRFHL